MFKFLNYLACTYFILLWSKMTEMTRLPRHGYSIELNITQCGYSVTGAFRRTSSTRPLISGQHNCVRA